MIVFFVASFVFGFAGASFAPIGPCVVSPEGCRLSPLFAFRNTSSAASFRRVPSWSSFCGSAHPDRALRSFSPCSPSLGPLRPHLQGAPRRPGRVHQDHPGQPRPLRGAVGAVAGAAALSGSDGQGQGQAEGPGYESTKVRDTGSGFLRKSTGENGFLPRKLALFLQTCPETSGNLRDNTIHRPTEGVR